MRRPLELAGLRGFVAAASRLSFTLAADELHLTQSAVSRQVAGLEDEIGQPLFLRKTRALALTAAGERLYRAAREGLDAIDRCVEQLRSAAAAPRVSITTYTSFASLWLLPRIAAFQRVHPQIEIRVDASDRAVDLEREGLDLALRRCRLEGAPPGALPLVEEDVTPVLTAELARRAGRSPLQPADLLRLPLIDIDTRIPNDPSSWRNWFALAGIADVQGGRGGMLFVGYSDQSIQAAVRGQGVALAQSPFYADLVADGQALAPFGDIRLVTGYRMVLVDNPATRERPEVALFRDWLLAQFRPGGRGAAGSAGTAAPRGRARSKSVSPGKS